MGLCTLFAGLARGLAAWELTFRAVRNEKENNTKNNEKGGVALILLDGDSAFDSALFRTCLKWRLINAGAGGRTFRPDLYIACD